MTLSPHARPITVTRVLLTSLAVLGAALVQPSQAQDYSAELAAVAALGDLTTAPAMWTNDTMPGTPATIVAGVPTTIYYDALDYQGNPTRVYAWVGIPATASASTPVPGVVLVHGGGGTASLTWVQKWTERGYAAISIAVEGQTDVDSDPATPGNQWFRHAMAGPARGALYNDSPNTLADQWMYHAVADCVLANSLLRSLPEVDAAKVGLSGFSWGGVITSTVIGIDTRFAFAIPTYGCGHKFDSRNYYGANLANNELYKNVWDPMIRIANATMPVLWFSWPEEPHFLMDSLAYTYHGAPGTRMVSLKPGMGHGSNWNSPEYYDYADSIVFGSGPWCVQQSLNLAGNTATAVFNSTKTLNTASLVYRTGNQPIITGVALETPNPWTEIAADSLVESPAGTWTVTATLPAGVTGWFVNVEATGSDTGGLYGYNDANITASSDYGEIINLFPAPAGGLAIEHPSTENQSTGTVDLSYSGPANVEITSIAIGAESHPGAFTSLATVPLVLLNPTPVQTPVTIQFDNTVAGLIAGESATGTVTIVWENLDGSTGQVALPVSATVRAPTTVIYDATADWSSQTVYAVDDVIIRNGATVTLDLPATQNLITNGSFETPDVTADADPGPPHGFQGVAAGNTALTGWTVSGATVFVIDGFDRFDAAGVPSAVASEGDQFAQLQIHPNVATISQDITTEIGQEYTLEFDYSALDFGSRSLTISYDVGGPVQTVNLTTADPQLPWVTETFIFTAAATTTTLSFTGDSFNGFYGPGIDNVRVTAVPAASAAATTITVNDDPSGVTATLAIDQDVALTASASMVLGAGTGASFVNQSTGSVTTPDLTVNSTGTGDLSQYNLSGGSVNAAALTVNANGELNLTGGSVTNAGTLAVASAGLLDIDGGTFVHPGTDVISGGGLIKLQSGTFSSGTDTSDGQILKTHVEISGGTFSMLNQVIFSQGAPYEFVVIGDDASITMRHLQFSGYTGSQGTLKWVLDETGVSPINVTSWMFLDLAKIVVDGSAYTGGAGAFPLLDSTAFLGLADPGNITVTGFAGTGLDASVVQDDVVEESVDLVLTLNAYGTWAAGYGLSGTDSFMAADPDGDGCNNLKEFALGGDPINGSDGGVLPAFADAAGVMEFTYLRRVNWASEGLTYTVKTATDLAGWGTGGLGTPDVDPTDPVSAYEWVTVPVSAGVPRRYVRLEIEGQ